MPRWLWAAGTFGVLGDGALAPGQKLERRGELRDAKVFPGALWVRGRPTSRTCLQHRWRPFPRLAVWSQK